MSGDFQIGEWSVQPAVNRLKRGDQVVRVEPKVMQVLVCLAENSGEVVTREQLIATVWPDVFVTDDVLHRAIRELRRVFGDSTAAPRYIETIRKRGYRLIPDLTNLTGTVPLIGGQSPTLSTADPAPTSVAAATSDPGVASARFSVLAAVVALAVVAALAVLATRSSDLAPQAHARFVPVVSGPLNESDPAVSPDGRRVAFVQREAGAAASADIYIRDLADGQITRVTDHPASDRMPAWAPDGSRLAFVRATAAACDIVVRTLATNTDARVTACGNPEDAKLAWTADGRALLTSFARTPHAESDWRIARIELATGAVTMLTDPPQGIVGDHAPTVSPDGRRIAFIRRASGGVSDIYVTSPDDGHAERLTFDEADLTGIDWAGDGQSIVYSSDRAGGYSLWRVPLDGGSPTLLAGGAARMKHPVADRAGRRVVYENWNYEINIWRVGQAGTSASPITRTSELWNIYPQVSPDGAHIAYVSTQSGTHQLWVAERDGSRARQLTRAAGGVVKSPRWSPDGRRLVYLARGRGAVDVQHVDVMTGVVTQLTATAANEVAPAWSHDSARVLYGAADDSGRWNVWSVDASTGGGARVDIANAVAAQPSADGTALYYTRSNERGLWRLTAGSTQEQLVTDHVEAANTHGWTVTASGIYYIAERDDLVRVRRAPLGGGASVEVATLDQFTWPGFSISPDETILYARWDRRDSNLMSIEY